MKDPKVTIISSLPPVKGISDYTSGLVGGLSKKISLEVLGFDKIYPEFLYPGGTKDHGKKKFEAPDVNQKNVLKWYNPFGWIVQAFKIKSPIVHAQWWSYILFPVYLTILTISKLRGKKIIVTVHNVKPHEKSILAQLANRTVLFFGDLYVVHSDQSKEEFIKRFPAKKNKISLVPHGVNEIPSKYTRKTAREELNLNDKDKVILFFGNVRPYKGLEDLIEAFKIARKETKNLKLIIAGKVWGGWEEYQKIIDEDLSQDIRLELNFISEPEISKYFEASDLVVLPYRYFDSQSGVATMSLSFKKPLIVTSVGGLPDLTAKEAVTKPYNVEDLAQTVTRFFSDDEFRNLLNKTAKEKSKQYSWDSIANQTNDLYEKILSD